MCAPLAFLFGERVGESYVTCFFPARDRRGRGFFETRGTPQTGWAGFVRRRVRAADFQAETESGGFGKRETRQPDGHAVGPGQGVAPEASNEGKHPEATTATNRDSKAFRGADDGRRERAAERVRSTGIRGRAKRENGDASGGGGGGPGGTLRSHSSLASAASGDETAATAATAADVVLLDVVLLKGTWDKKSGHHVVPRDVISNLARLCETGLDVVVLTDCDVAGRQLRSRVVLEVPTALHAFLGAHESSAAADTKWHAAGNVGVEHASVGAIRGAVRRARRAHSDGGSHGVSRNQFTRDDLTKHGLCGPDDASPDPVWRVLGGVATRRRLVGEYLGIGDCDAKQLVRQLNLFFEVCEFEDAIDALPKKGDDIPRKMTDGGAARFAGEHETANDNSQVDIYAYVPPGQAPLGFK